MENSIGKPWYSDAWFIYLLALKLSGSYTKKLTYYAGNAIRMHYGIKYGISSERFGKFIINFSDHLRSHQYQSESMLKTVCKHICDELNELKNDQEWIDYAKKSLNAFPTDNPLQNFQFASIHHYPSKQLKTIAENLNRVETNTIQSFNSSFAKIQANQIDWTTPFPSPDFPQFTFVDRLIEHGIAYWIPVVKSNTLVDIGSALIIPNWLA